jgi:type I restriction enzyme, S subunit
VMSKVQELPKGWVLAKISEVFTFIGGGTPSKDNQRYWNGGISWASVKDIKGDYLIKTINSISEVGLKNSAANLAKPGDVILVTRINPGKTIITRIATAINQDLKIVRMSSEIKPSFVKYLFCSIEHQLISLSSGTTVLGLSIHNLNEIEILLPPLPEQRRIVAKIEELFSSLDKGMASLKSARDELKVYRQAVLMYAFEGRLTAKWRGERKGAGEEGELPEGWSKQKIGSLVINKEGLRRGPFGSAIRKEFFIKDGYKVYEQANAINDDSSRGHYYISKEKYNELSSFKVIPDDLIVSCSGTIGRITCIPANAGPGIINQALLRIRLNSDLILIKYFVPYFRASFFQKIIVDQSQGTAMSNLIGIKDFKEIEILLPTLAEQAQIVAEIETRLSVCDKLEATIQESLVQAEALRQSILKKAFEGRLVPQDPSDEPASALLERIRAERESAGPRQPRAGQRKRGER